MTPLMWKDRGQWVVFAGVLGESYIRVPSLGMAMEMWSQICGRMMELNAQR